MADAGHQQTKKKSGLHWPHFKAAPGSEEALQQVRQGWGGGGWVGGAAAAAAAPALVLQPTWAAYMSRLNLSCRLVRTFSHLPLPPTHACGTVVPNRRKWCTFTEMKIRCQTRRPPISSGTRWGSTLVWMGL